MARSFGARNGYRETVAVLLLAACGTGCVDRALAKYQQARERCMAQLFDAVARDHRVTAAQVRASLEHRRTGVDVGVIACFFLIYGFAAAATAGWIFRSFSFQHAWAAALVMLVASVLVSIAGWISGGLWSAAVEMIRIGNDHMSYRGARTPWSQHQLGCFVACVVVFWLAAVVRYRFSRPEVSTVH